MAEDATIEVTKTLHPGDSTAFPNTTANNDDVKRKLENQDQLANPNTNPGDIQAAGDALDDLLKQTTTTPEPPNEPATPPPTPTPDPEAAKKAEELEAQKRAEEQRKADELKKADEIFAGSPGLPNGASPKSSEAFATIKIKAAQEITSRDTKIAELTAKLDELSKVAANPLTPEIDRELQELRRFRAQLDVEADPKFKQFDAAAKSAEEFIYSQLKRSPVVDDQIIELIRSKGGPTTVRLDKVFEKIGDPLLQRTIESKIAEIEHLRWQKQQAIDETKKNVDSYVADRAKQFEQAAKSHYESTKANFDGLLAQIPWSKPQTVPAGAAPEEAKRIEENNAWLANTLKQLDAALQDDSSEMRAIQIAGMAQLFHLQREHSSTLKELEASKKSLEEAQQQLTKLRSAQRVRVSEGGIQPGSTLPQPTKPVDVNTRPADALDQIAKQVMEEQARAKSTA